MVGTEAGGKKMARKVAIGEQESSKDYWRLLDTSEKSGKKFWNIGSSCVVGGGGRDSL
jgi:hypothetical protein